MTVGQMKKMLEKRPDDEIIVVEDRLWIERDISTKECVPIKYFDESKKDWNHYFRIMIK
jgi:hypothetical protein